MANFYCRYCGEKFLSISSLTGQCCPRHPAGTNKGKHALYEGAEKSQYFCKHCGAKFSSLRYLTGQCCPRHPAGTNKGRHEPAL
ncbi:MAG: hypothetical protein ACI4SG_03065 [Oligosphaeraceae bacterium]